MKTLVVVGHTTEVVPTLSSGMSHRKGKRKAPGPSLATSCHQVAHCPSGDPDNDTEITADCVPEDYIANKALHDMIELTVQADDVELQLCVVGGRHSSDVEEEVEEEEEEGRSIMMRAN